MHARIQLVEQVGAVWTGASSSARSLGRIVATTPSSGTTEVLQIRAVSCLVDHVGSAGVGSGVHAAVTNGTIVGAVAARVACGGCSAAIGPAVT